MISKTSYPNYDIVIVQAGERDKVHEGSTDFRVLHFPQAASDSAAKNYAVAQTDSPWLLFLDDNVEAIDRTGSQSWVSMCSGPRLAQSARD